MGKYSSSIKSNLLVSFLNYSHFKQKVLSSNFIKLMLRGCYPFTFVMLTFALILFPAPARMDDSSSTPEIAAISPTAVRIEGGTPVTVLGSNFAPGSLVIVEGKVVKDAVIVSSNEIHFQMPQLTVPGARTLSVLTPVGLAQKEFTVVTKPLSELAMGDITTIAGGGQFIGDGGKAVEASFLYPTGVAVDQSGNIFITDLFSNSLRQVDATTGKIFTIAGGKAGFNGDNQPSITAALSLGGLISSVAVDNAGNILIGDVFNHRIRRIDARTKMISTIAGNGECCKAPLTGPAQSVNIYSADAITVDKSNNIYLSDGNLIRRIDAKTGMVKTVAGNGTTGSGGDNGPATEAGFYFPLGIAVDPAGNIYIADTENHRVRRVDAATGIITTVAGNGESGFSGDGGPATEASLDRPTSVVLDTAGNIYISDDYNDRIRKVDAHSGIITTYAGNDDPRSDGDGQPATNATLERPEGMTIDAAGNLFVTDRGHFRIRHIDAQSGIITTVAGNGHIGIEDNGRILRTSLDLPDSVAIDTAGRILVNSYSIPLVRRLDISAGTITTIAGTFGNFSGGDGGLATNAGVFPTAIALDHQGNLFIGDSFDLRVRRVDATTGIITTVAGNGESGFGGDGGPATSANIDSPFSLAFDNQDNLFIVDAGNFRVRRVDQATGIITTVAGNGDPKFSGDGELATLAGIDPREIALDQNGNLYIADPYNHRVRRVDAKTRIITTVAGSGAEFYTGDGELATKTGLALPAGLAVDRGGNIFILDADFDNRVLIVDAKTGVIATVAGNGEAGYNGDGGPAISARLSVDASGAVLGGLAIDQDGNLVILDTYNNAVRIVKGIAAGQGIVTPKVTITDVLYKKPFLEVRGVSFGKTGVSITINNRPVSPASLISQTDTKLVLRGSKRKLNLKSGDNQVTVTVNGQTSNTFTFNLLFP